MKYMLCLVLLSSLFLYADAKKFYFYGDKVLNEDDYQKLSSADRKKVEYSFGTIWQIKTERIDVSRVRVLLLSKEIQILIGTTTLSERDRIKQGGDYFKVHAESYSKAFKLEKPIKKGKKMSFGGKKCYSGTGRNKEGIYFQLITRTRKDKRWHLAIMIQEKDLRLKPVRKAFSAFMSSFKFMQ